jgi:hypothetical protein
MDAPPNIEALAEHVHGVGVELSRLRNLPAFDNGVMILEQLQQLQQQQHQHQHQQYQQMQQMQQQQQQMQQQLTRLETAVTRLETAVTRIDEKSDITETNALARFENNHVSRGDHELVLPVSFDTGTTVVDCPDTANEILHLGCTCFSKDLV